MIWKNAFKNPILMIGILCMIIFLSTMRGKSKFFDRFDKLKATSCNSVLIMLDKRRPKEWKTECEENNLAVIIPTPLMEGQFKKKIDFRAALYRELANHLMYISKNSLRESLERVFIVRIRLESRTIVINAVTEGKFIAQMATLKNPEIMANHIQSTVQVQESVK